MSIPYIVYMVKYLTTVVTTRIEKMKEEPKFMDNLRAIMKRTKELNSPIVLPMALSKDLPTPNFFKLLTYYYLILSILYLKASSQPYNLTYFIPSITSVDI